jgi:hypothetical protein
MHHTIRLTRLLTAFMIGQATLGLMLPDLYRDVEPIRTTWFGNDWITLALGAPLLLVSGIYAARGSARGLLVWLGTIAYAVYNYSFYLFGAALNAFFPLYVSAVVIGATSLILALAQLQVTAVVQYFREGTPVRAVGGSLVVIGTALGIVWLIMWAAFVFAGRPTPVHPEAFKVVAALDLTLMVPALTVGGSLLWRRRRWGYIVATLASVQGALYLLVLSVNSWIAIRRGLAAAPGELPIWVPLTLVTTLIALILLANVRRQPVLPHDA